MNTPRTTTLSLLLCLVATLALVCACNKACQTPPTEVPKTITANPWRLIETTNPALKNNNRFTFIIMEYALDFSGQVRKVVNNREFETPFRTFKYRVESSNGRNGTLRIAYFKVSLEGGEEGQDTAGQEPTETTDYRYALGRTLTLTETRTGYNYRFVPFVGIVDPDSNCTF